MTALQPRYSKEEFFARRGTEIYEQQVRPQVENDNQGKIVAIDIDSGSVTSVISWSATNT